VVGAAWIVGPGVGQPPTAGTPSTGGVSSIPLRIVTSDFDGPSGMEALLLATLTADPNGCVRARAGQSTVTLVWPRGYTVRGNSQSFEILDALGNVVARSGVQLRIGGGSADHFQDTWTGRACAGGRLWMVGAVN
jgi:hypothetical protein